MCVEVAVIVADDVKQVRNDGCGVEQALAVSKRGDKLEAQTVHDCLHDLWPFWRRQEPARAVGQGGLRVRDGQFQHLFLVHVKNIFYLCKLYRKH